MTTNKEKELYEIMFKINEHKSHLVKSNTDINIIDVLRTNLSNILKTEHELKKGA